MPHVTTPAVVTVTAVCPECDASIDIDVDLIASLTVEDGERTLKVKSKSKAYAHVHGQLTIDGQATLEEAVGDLARLTQDDGVESVTITAGDESVTLDAAASRRIDARLGRKALDELNRDLDEVRA